MTPPFTVRIALESDIDDARMRAIYLAELEFWKERARLLQRTLEDLYDQVSMQNHIRLERPGMPGLTLIKPKIAQGGGGGSFAAAGGVGGATTTASGGGNGPHGVFISENGKLTWMGAGGGSEE